MGNRILTDDIVSNISLPFTKDSLDFIQNAYKSDIASAFIAQIEDYQINTVYRAYGFDYDLSGGEITFTDGVLFYNGEFYGITGVSNLPIADTPVFQINTDFAPFDPTELRPAGTGAFDVHQIQTFVVQDGTSGSGVGDVENIDGLVRYKTVNIGPWDMNNTAFVTLTFPDEVKKGVFQSVEAVITNDAGTTDFPLDYLTVPNPVPGATWNANKSTEELSLFVIDGSFFKTNSSFSGGVANRGILTYKYKY